MSIINNISCQPTADFNDSHQMNQSMLMEDLSPFGYCIAAVALFGIMITGCISNLIVIIVIGGTKRLRTPMNAILLNLSVSDFIISSFGTPLSFASAINNRWIFGETLCQIYAFLMTLTGEFLVYVNACSMFLFFYILLYFLKIRELVLF